MNLEAYPEGVQVQGPAVVIRRGAHLGAGIPAGRYSVVPEGREAPPPQRPEAFSAYRDTSSISREAMSLYGGLAAQSGVPAQTGAPVSSQQSERQVAAEGARAEDPSSPATRHETGQVPASESGSEKQGASGEDKQRREDPAGDRELSEEEKQEVRELEQRDREVRQHEQAHQAAAGHLAQGGANYEYEQGPDGRQYATGGDVSVQVGGGSTAEERLRNAEKAERAAMAPAEPSPQDRKVAAEARAQATEAKRDLQQQRAEEMRGGQSGDETSGSGEGDGPSTGESISASPSSIHKSGEDSPTASIGDDEGRSSGAARTEGPLAKAARAYGEQGGDPGAAASMGRTRSLEAALLGGGMVNTFA